MEQPWIDYAGLHHQFLDQFTTTPTTRKETREEEKKVSTFTPKIITGGRDGDIPPPTGTGNWLKDLEPGTMFFVQNKLDRTDFALGMFILASKKGPQYKVICLKHPEMQNLVFVDPIRFCGRYELYHNEGVMYLPPEQLSEEDNKGDEDEQCDRLPGDGAGAPADLGEHAGEPDQPPGTPAQ